MKNFLIAFVLGAAVAFFILKGCESCNKTMTNETDNIDRVDSLDIIQTAQAPLRGQIVENERIIASLSTTVDELRAKEKAGNDLAGKLAKIIDEQNATLKMEQAKLEHITILLTETQAQFSAAIVRNDSLIAGNDVQLFSTTYDDPDDWFHLSGNFDLNTNRADYLLSVRNEFYISDFVAKDGVAKFRVESKNPFTFSLPGTNSFSVPIVIEKAKQRRLGVGLTAGTFAVKDFFSSNVTIGYGGGIGIYWRLL